MNGWMKLSAWVYFDDRYNLYWITMSDRSASPQTNAVLVHPEQLNRGTIPVWPWPRDFCRSVRVAFPGGKTVTIICLNPGDPNYKIEADWPWKDAQGVTRVGIVVQVKGEKKQKI